VGVCDVSNVVDLQTKQLPPLHRGLRRNIMTATVQNIQSQPQIKVTMKPLAELFNLGNRVLPSEAMRTTCANIPVFANPSEMVPANNPKFYYQEQLLEDILSCFLLSQPAMLVGPKGAGKTDVLIDFAAKTGRELITVSCSSKMDIETLLGYVGLNNGSTVIEKGILAEAWEKGQIVILDEVDALREDVQLALHEIAEPSSKTLTMPVAGGNVDVILKRHKNFRLFATSNTGGKAERDAQYRGGRLMGGALLDRFVRIEVGYLPEDIEKQLLQDLLPGLTSVAAGMMVDIANEIRTSYLNGEATDTLSMRSLIQWGKFWLLQQVPERGFLLAVFNSYSSDMKLLAYNSYTAHFPEALPLSEAEKLRIGVAA